MVARPAMGTTTLRINLSKSLAQNYLLLNTGVGLYSVGTFDLSEQR